MNMIQAAGELRGAFLPAAEVLPFTDGMLQVSVVSNEKDFDKLEEAWDELVRDSDCTIFQTYEWQRTWWKYFNDNRELHCVLFKDNSRLVAIAPMFVDSIRIFGLYTVKVLKFITGEDSDYIDLVIADGYRERVIRAFVDYLYSSSAAWDVFEMREVSERFPTLKLLPLYLERRGFKVFMYRGNVCPQVALPRTWEEFLTHLGGNLRYQLKKKMERLTHRFPIEVEITTNDERSVENALREFADIHGRRWESLGYKNAFKNDRFFRFHVDASQQFAKRGWLRIFFLKVDGQRVAVNFDFNFRRRIYFYHGNAHGPDEIMKFSPGFLLRCAAIREGITEGMNVYDMLRGNESYKTTDFKCIPVANWQIRAVIPSGNHSAKFRLFLLRELAQKIPRRIQRDLRDWRRFYMTQKPTPLMALKFMSTKLTETVAVMLYYFNRFYVRRQLDKSKNS